MDAKRATTRLVRIGAAVAAAALLTSACAAGQHAITAEELPTLDGTNGRVGQINLRGVTLQAPASGAVNYPAGSRIPIRLVLVNNGQQPDTLTSVTSPAFQNWRATPSNSVQIQPGTRTSWGTPEARGNLVLINTTKKLFPGTTIRMTFSFAKAGSVTLPVPIALSSSPNTSPIPSPTTTSIEG